MGRGVWWTLWSIMLAMVFWSSSTPHLQVGAVPAQAPEQCGASGCTLNNAYMLWNDRSPCKAAKVVYPTTEDEIVAAVADAVRSNQKVKVATTYGHSIPKVACPGTDSGVIISSRKYTRILSVDKVQNTVTAQSGVTMRELVDGIASLDLALAVGPYFDGVTLGGVIANSVHGSSLWGKGGAIHEYVVAMTIVTPASAAEGYARVRILESGDPDLNAAKVNLGVLGVVSAVTLQVEPQFKRNVTMELVMGDGELTGAKVLEFANQNQYGEVMWYPGLRQVVYKHDNRVAVTTPGDGRNNYYGLQAQLGVVIVGVRANEEFSEFIKSRQSKCILAHGLVTTQQLVSYGFENNKNHEGHSNLNLTLPKALMSAFPVIGNQNFIMSGGGCQKDNRSLFYCPWEGRIPGLVFYEAGAALPLQNVGAFIEDVKVLRDIAPNDSFCDMDLYTGILFRFTKKTETYMGTAQEDAVMVDFTWTRGNDGRTPRLDMDIFQEIEQLVIDKYGARPHWGKNRNFVFEDAWKKYAKLKKFLEVKEKFDPKGIFSSEWSDVILGINEPNMPRIPTNAPFCAIEGNCKCTKDEHCAPEMKNFCRPGLIYPNAKVCRTEI